LAYLARHPQAQDTLEGIVQWWLLEQRLYRTTSEVRTALEALVAKGQIVARQGRDGRIYYRAGFPGIPGEESNGTNENDSGSEKRA
jgi:hypothetical protein